MTNNQLLDSMPITKQNIMDLYAYEKLQRELMLGSYEKMAAEGGYLEEYRQLNEECRQEHEKSQEQQQEKPMIQEVKPMIQEAPKRRNFNFSQVDKEFDIMAYIEKNWPKHDKEYISDDNCPYWAVRNRADNGLECIKIFPKDFTGGGRDEFYADTIGAIRPGVKIYEGAMLPRCGATDFLRLANAINKEEAKNLARKLIDNDYVIATPSISTNNGRDIKIMSFATSLKEEPIKKPTFLVDRLIYEKSINLISGDPKTYKTYIGIEIAIGTVTGKSVLGHHVNNTGGVLFLSTEFDTRQRFLDMLKGKWYTDEEISSINNLYIPSFESLDTFQWHKDKQYLRDLLKQTKPKLLVLDPLTFIFDGDITKNDEVAEFFKELKRMIIEFDLTILLIHHNNRMNENKRMNNVSGASAITRFSDSIIYLERFNEDEEQDINKEDEELDKAIKDIKMIKGVYRYGGEGYKYHRVSFQFGDNDTVLSAERYSNNEEAAAKKNIPQKESIEILEREIKKAIDEGKLGVNFKKENVLSVINNHLGKENKTFVRYIELALKELVDNGSLRSVRGIGYTTQLEL